MKYLLIALLITGCTSNDGRMSYEDMHDKYDEALINGSRHIVTGNSDSAYYYKGKIDALYQAMYNKP